MEIGSFHNVSVYYKNLKALDNLSFSFEKAEIFGLLGPNGSGKTTTMKVLNGLLKPNSGHASIEQLEVWKNKNKIKKDIGYCPQFNSFNEKLTVRENIKYFADLYKIKGNLDNLAYNTCSYLGLSNKIDTLAENLSGGLKRRLNIALGILHEPKILFLDEPSVGLDPISRNELWKLIKKLRSEGTTIILATNIMEEAEYLCDRVVLLKNGRNIISGNLSEIRKKIPHTETIIIYTKFSAKTNNKKIIHRIKKLNGVIDFEFSNDVIKIKTREKKTGMVKKSALAILKKSSVGVEDVRVVSSTLIDAFEILVGSE